MQQLLNDDNGQLKPFNQWAKEVLPIASHHCGAWLQTEYNTAVIRAHQAADWQQFEREADIYPNLKWIPSTSITPGQDHIAFWNTILPIHHPFWTHHRPGDRWNCKCALTSTDEEPTKVPTAAQYNQPSDPQPGLTSNPGIEKATFSQDHPYFPNSCAACPFNKQSITSRLRSIFFAKAKDCYNCSQANQAVKQAEKEKTNIAQQLHQLTNAKGNEEGKIAKEIVETNDFVPLDNKKHANIYKLFGNDKDYLNIYKKKDKNDIEKEDANLFAAAKKLTQIFNKVFIMPNPKSTKSCDFIMQDKAGFYHGYELKTISGQDSVSDRLQSSVGQANRVILNLCTKCETQILADNIKAYFQQNKDAKEVIIMQRKSSIRIIRRDIEGNNFNDKFGRARRNATKNTRLK